MNTVTVQHVFEQDMWQQDEPLLCFEAAPSADRVRFGVDSCPDHIVGEMFDSGNGTYLTRCCCCGGEWTLAGEQALRVEAWQMLP